MRTPIIPSRRRWDHDHLEVAQAPATPGHRQQVGVGLRLGKERPDLRLGVLRERLLGPRSQVCHGIGALDEPEKEPNEQIHVNTPTLWEWLVYAPVQFRVKS